MPGSKKRENLFTSEQGADIRRMLEEMMKDSCYNTAASYCANSEKYPDNQMPFIDKHLTYLNAHPAVDPTSYLANLKLMTKVS